MNKKTSGIKTDPSTWVEEHGDVLYRYALLRVKDPQVAEDLVQETFIAALEGLAKFKGQSSIRTWLVGILKHKTIDYFRKSQKEIPSSDLTLMEDASEDEAYTRIGMRRWGQRYHEWHEDPSNLVENREFWGAFRGCLDGLPDGLQRAFALRELEDLQTAEICKILDITPTNLWVMLHRARAKLRDCLDATWFRGKRS